MRVEIVNSELPDFRGKAQLIRAEDGRHFVVSSVNAPFSGPETLVFTSDAEGEVQDWAEVAGGRRMTQAEAIADLEEVLDGSQP